ncbi:Rib/alpha-like domain-containing protein [Limosilactobacillus mucosae]|uniref:Rib/alpha-like domain-containing protein n=2 Tax=Lactobacillaceae TaxID=33958 RepID=UPI00233F0997|nr:MULTISPECIES: Rib/alpha-like domain-containing protein [Limosilactobacillus]MDC2840191.1 Rib/alpha-like domain-containing protein [Limosilactobacillus mucosae]MDC2840918.1 Rib/alpha-like domain-containing protein [Limosilactobacillus mucosae]MDC2845578.1 Rib/alpha-like domain-containing protein [Limosilactobacillus mucosae]MDM8219506.1 Rib/alpha-like domain-containing protein [Limosilactobacillus mucosae]MDM8314162.1 Rib/alpha-like domain-containing protein [Limosilactobacillus mucosae]
MTKMAGKYAIETRKIVYMPGDTLNPREGIANWHELPEKTSYAWQQDPILETPGLTQVTIVVAYPDDSQAAVKVPVEVLPRPVKQKGRSKNVSIQVDHQNKRTPGTILTGNQRGTMMDAFAGIGLLFKAAKKGLHHRH